jgi:hypothetical protein
MTAKITMHIARDDLSKRIIQWIQFLNPKLSPLTEKEMNLLEEVFRLPDKFFAVPFSTIPKRLYGERLKIEPLALQRLIASLFKKGYLVKDEYEEMDILHLLKGTMVRGLKEESKIRFELDWVLDGDNIRTIESKSIRGIHPDIIREAKKEVSPSSRLSSLKQEVEEKETKEHKQILNEDTIQSSDKSGTSNGVPLSSLELIEAQKKRLAEYRARRKQS